ncbi:MAG TPA: response regulator [Geobacteraceae bacterium]|nr:response regulator [Geobacteraceae bacterium]
MKKRVLVVDDSEIVLAKAGEVLVAGGYEVQTALSAQNADVYLYGENRPDLVIMDVMMPHLDGDKKARLLKSDEVTRGIPILLLSSKSEDELGLLVRESGCEGFIRKPFTSEQMVARVAEALGKC